MGKRPTYEELGKMVKDLEKQLSELKQENQRIRYLSSAAEQSLDGLALVDLDGNIIELNESFAKMHGYSKDELAGANLSVFHSLEQMQSVDEANSYLKEHGKFKGEILHVRRDGTVFPSQMINSLFYDETGNLAGMIGTCRDITKAKAAEEALRQSEERLSAILEANPYPVVVYDTEGHPQYLNPAFTEVFGWIIDELKGQRIPFVPHDQKEITAAKIALNLSSLSSNASSDCLRSVVSMDTTMK